MKPVEQQTNHTGIFTRRPGMAENIFFSLHVYFVIMSNIHSKSFRVQSLPVTWLHLETEPYLWLGHKGHGIGWYSQHWRNLVSQSTLKYGCSDAKPEPYWNESEVDLSNKKCILQRKIEFEIDGKWSPLLLFFFLRKKTHRPLRSPKIPNRPLRVCYVMWGTFVGGVFFI